MSIQRLGLYLLMMVLGVFGAIGLWHWYAERQAPHEQPASPRVEEPAAQSDELRPRHREVVFRIGEREPESAVAQPGIDARWVEKNREGIGRLKARKFAEAAQLFEACVAAVPEERVFRANAAEALARLGNEQWEQGKLEQRQAGLASMRRAAELAPDRADIRQRLDQMQRLLASEEGNWTEILEHYELSFDGERTDLVWDSLTLSPLLESIYGEYGEHFDCWPVERGREKIRVVLYNREEFHQATGIGHWAGGVFDGAVRIPVSDLKRDKREVERVLRHEIAHAFVAFSGGRAVPGWLNEGVAQWLESSDFVQRSQHVAAVRKLFGSGPKIPLQELGGSLAELKEEARIQRAYQQSLLLIDKIERDYGERVVFQMVQGCMRKQSPEQTFRERTSLELQSVLDDL
jgi:tetratricopeptide (TPR) repeat protein